MSTCDRCGADVWLVRVGTVIMVPETRVREGDEVHEWVTAEGGRSCLHDLRHSVAGVLRSYYRDGFCVRQVLRG